MKQLSRNEVVGLIMKALLEEDKKITHGSGYRQLTHATLQALEDNGILTLVEGEPQVGDFIRLQLRHKSGLGSTIDYIKLEVPFDEQLEYLEGDYEAHRLIMRDNILAYQCKKG